MERRRWRAGIGALLALIGTLVAVGLPAAPASATSHSPDTRVAGADRYETAAAISRQVVPDPPRVVGGLAYVTTGQRYADALGAGPAAAKLGAPVLLTTASALPAATKAELARLHPRGVLVVGGAAAVSDAVLLAVQQAAGAPAVRLAEGDRYGTAVRVAQHAFPTGARVVHVAAAEGFADGLAGGAAAARAGGPLLLVPRDALPPAVAAELVRLRATEIRIVGGEGAVSPAVEAQLRSMAPTVTRTAGADRFETSAALTGDLGSAETAVLAAGGDFADALAGVPLARRLGAPLLLTAGTCTPEPVAAELDRLGVDDVVLAGGVGAQSHAVAQEARSCARKPGPPRVALIGDSVMYQATPAIDEALAARRWEVEGYAVPGTGLLTGVFGATESPWQRRSREIVDGLDPDVVVASFVGAYFAPEGTEGLELGSEEMRAAWTAAFRVVDAQLRARGATVWWTLVPPILSSPWREQALLVNDIAAREAPGRTIDAFSEFGGAGPYDPTGRDVDGVHLDGEGNRRYAGLVAESITPSGV